MKKILCGVLTVIAICTFITVFSAGEVPAVTLSGVAEVESEGTFDVYVTVTENSNIGGGRITVGYDNSVLEIVSITADTLLSGTSLQVNLAYTDSSARVSWAGVSNLTEAGSLMKITFKAKAVYQDVDTAVTIDSIKVTDADTNVVDCDALGCNIKVKAKALPTFSVVSPEDALIGTNIDVTVNISDNTLACGGRFDLVYDNTRLEVVSAQTGSLLTGTTAFVNPNYASDTVRLSWASSSALADGGVLVTVTFKVLDNPGEALITLNKAKMTDENGTTMECISQSGSVNAVSELICSASTVYCEENGRLKFTTTVKNCPEDAILTVALYDGNVMVGYSASSVSGESVINTYLDKMEFASAKVMLWDGFTPLAEYEELK